MAVEERIAQMVEQALEKTMKDIRARIQDAADHVLEQRLAELGYDDDYIDRYEAAQEFNIPVWKVRDLQLSGKAGNILRRGKHALVSRKALAEALRKAA